MQKKLSKHFIYKWLEEDLYGEYMLHHNTNKFSNQVLLNIWNFLNDSKRSQRSSLVAGFKSNKVSDFVASTLRYSLLLNSLDMANSNLLNIYSVSEKKIFKLKNCFYKNLFLYFKDTLITNRVQKYFKILPNKKRLFFFKMRKNYLNLKSNNFFLNSVKYRWRGSRRILRTRSMYKLHNLNFFLKNNNILKLVSSNLQRGESINKVNFVKRRSQKFKQAIFRRNFTSKFLKVWRFNLNVGIKLNNFNFSTNKKYNSLNLKNYILSFSWDSFAYKLKQRVRKIMQTSKAVKKFLLNMAYAKLKFKGVFQKRALAVKKNEISRVLNFRLLNYYNLVVTPADLNKIYYNIYYKGKFFQLPSLSSLEFNLVPILLRAGFFENGYIVNSLSKRNLFLINGSAVKSNVLVNVWDIISLSKSVWWLVYARYTNFFNIFTTFDLSSSNTYYKNKSFIKQFIKMKNLFKKFDYRKKLSIRGSLSRLVYLKNYIFSLPPAYMEVSYKLFIIIIYRIINKSTDISAPINRRGLKSILPSFATRTFS